MIGREKPVVDSDGLGNQLEAAIGTCASSSGSVAGANCNELADPRDTDNDGQTDIVAFGDKGVLTARAKGDGGFSPERFAFDPWASLCSFRQICRAAGRGLEQGRAKAVPLWSWSANCCSHPARWGL